MNPLWDTTVFAVKQQVAKKAVRAAQIAHATTPSPAQRQTLVGCASDLHSVTTTSAKQVLKPETWKNPLMGIRWLLMAVTCTWRSHSLAAELYKEDRDTLSPASYSILGAIFYLWQQQTRVRTCVVWGLGKGRSLQRVDRALLLILKAKTHRDEDGNIIYLLEEIETLLRDGGIIASSPQQAVRILRDLSALYSKLGNGEEARALWEESVRLAERIGAEDQLLKISKPPTV